MQEVWMLDWIRGGAGGDTGCMEFPMKSSVDQAEGDDGRLHWYNSRWWGWGLGWEVVTEQMDNDGTGGGVGV